MIAVFARGVKAEEAKFKILFVDKGGLGRSQIVRGIVERRAKGAVEVEAAGTQVAE